MSNIQWFAPRSARLLFGRPEILNFFLRPCVCWIDKHSLLASSAFIQNALPISCFMDDDVWYRLWGRAIQLVPTRWRCCGRSVETVLGEGIVDILLPPCRNDRHWQQLSPRNLFRLLSDSPRKTGPRTRMMTGLQRWERRERTLQKGTLNAKSTLFSLLSPLSPFVMLVPS